MVYDILKWVNKKIDEHSEFFILTCSFRSPEVLGMKWGQRGREQSQPLQQGRTAGLASNHTSGKIRSPSNTIGLCNKAQWVKPKSGDHQDSVILIQPLGSPELLSTRWRSCARKQKQILPRRGTLLPAGNHATMRSPDNVINFSSTSDWKLRYRKELSSGYRQRL